MIVFQKRDKFCENVTTPSSQPLKEIVEETMSYPFKKAFEDGKTVWNLSPGMMSGHLEGKGGLSVKMLSFSTFVVNLDRMTTNECLIHGLITER